MNFPKNVWDQLKNISINELISALKKDGWDPDEKASAVQAWVHPDGRIVTIHYHPRKTFGPKLLKKLLTDIGWTIKDMRRLKLI
mgnify:CR=1 FL=1